MAAWRSSHVRTLAARPVRLLRGYLVWGAILATPACSSTRTFGPAEDGGPELEADAEAISSRGGAAGRSGGDAEVHAAGRGQGGDSGGSAATALGGASLGAGGSAAGGLDAGSGEDASLGGDRHAGNLPDASDAQPEAGDLCPSNPCENEGQCNPSDGSCTCEAGYTGARCETRIVSCSPNPCANGGSCALEQGTVVCTCPSGYSGSRCKTNIDDCASKPCRNGGTCTDGLASYTCTCPKGYSGVNCERVVSTCSDAPCLNGATCTNNASTGYTCACPTGYTGTNCETNINDCTSNACQNGGICIDGVASYTCTCPAGFRGSRCETNIDDCAAQPCQNHGTCVDGVASYTCQCDSRYTGANCEYLKFKLAGLLYGTDDTTVKAMSGDGRIVLFDTSGDSGEYVARMADFGSVIEIDLSALKANGRHVAGVSRDGAVIGGDAQEGSGAWLPYWLNGGVTARWLDNYMPAGSGGVVRDVSADGSTLVGIWTDDSWRTHAFRFRTAAEVVDYVSDFQGAETEIDALAVSGDGSVIAGGALGSDSLYARVWRWDARTNQTVNLQLPTGWIHPRVADISTDGNVIVGEATINGVWSAVRWVGANGTAEQLGTGALYGTNADGSVSVGVDGSGRAAVWTSSYRARPVTDILGTNPDGDGANLFSAVAVSEDGTIVAGNSTVVVGTKSTTQGWVARIR